MENTFAHSGSSLNGERARLSNAGDEVDLYAWFVQPPPTHFFGSLYTFNIVTFFCLEHIYFPPELFSIAFLSGLQIKSNRYIAEPCDIIFWAYSTMYWIMPVHASFLPFSADWERGTVGPRKFTWRPALRAKSRPPFRLQEETEQVFVTQINLVQSSSQWVLNHCSHRIVSLIK